MVTNRSRIKKWSNIKDVLALELYVDEDGIVRDMQHERQLPLDKDLIRGDTELLVRFKSSGYSDPGVVYGDPERCYPPEGSDERIIDAIYLAREDGNIVLQSELYQPIFDLYEDKIYEVELDYNEYNT